MPVDSNSQIFTRFLVCWSVPRQLQGDNEIILSFLPPSLEDWLSRTHAGIVICAREASRHVRAQARRLYIDLVAHIGAVPYSPGQSFRKALAPPGQTSRWWYHPVAFKGCESDPTFDRIIAVLTIRLVAEQYGVKKLVLVGAPQEMVMVLKNAFEIEEKKTCKSFSLMWLCLHGLASRIKYVLLAFREWLALQRHLRIPQGAFDVCFSGFWDWSVWWDEQAQSLTDRYFKGLPSELRRQSASTVGWFAWFDPRVAHEKKPRSLAEMLRPLRSLKNVVILQLLLKPWDIVKAVVDLRPLAVFLRIHRRRIFRESFRAQGFDFYPLFSGRLFSGFLDSTLPHFELVSLATARACDQYRSKTFISFLEHFLHARAQYEGVRRSGNHTVSYAIQHASYCYEKTFLSLHSTLEWEGEPDGCSVPHPDYVCAMGTLGQELFLESGYPKERVLLTGSSRYDDLKVLSTDASPSIQGTRAGRVRLLMVASLHIDLELNMLGAVFSAARDVEDIQLLFRNHPFSQVERHPGFIPFKDSVELTSGSLEEDLDQADLIIFTYSTIAEEAFLRNKPVWQWLPLGFNGSALVEVATIPQFWSVAGLRSALRDFRDHPQRFLPGLDARRLALERLFYRGDGKASMRIASAVISTIAKERVCP